MEVEKSGNGVLLNLELILDISHLLFVAFDWGINLLLKILQKVDLRIDPVEFDSDAGFITVVVFVLHLQIQNELLGHLVNFIVLFWFFSNPPEVEFCFAQLSTLSVSDKYR